MTRDILEVTFTLSLLAAQAVFAEEASTQERLAQLEKEISALKKERGNFENWRQIQKGVGVFATTDILYWYVRENGLTFAIENRGNSSIADDSDFKNPNFDWNLGFKLGVGCHLPSKGWDLYLNVTHLHIKANGEAHAKEGEFLFPVWTNAVTTGSGFVNKANFYWRLHFAFVDLELGREFLIGKNFALRPFVGARVTWVRQKSLVGYYGGNLFPGGEDRVSMKNKFWGIGPRAGFGSRWEWGKGWGIYGDAAVSAPYGMMYVHEHEKATVGILERGEIHHRYHIARIITDLAVGLCWDHLFHRDRYHLGFHFGWEQHMLFGQNQFVRFVDDKMQGAYVSNQGDLAMQGITFGLLFDF